MTLDRPLTKAVIKKLGSSEPPIEVMYNPTEYTSSSEAKWRETGAQRQFEMLSYPSFTVTLVFDTYEKRGPQGDVRYFIDKLALLQQPTVLNGDRRQPPKCAFSWGDKFSYEGVITKLDRRFTMFREDGTPVRAEVTVTFEEVLEPDTLKKRRGEDNCRKLRVVRQGDRLDSIAAEQLGAASKWRAIAALNGIDDPLAFPTTRDVGRTLIIPDEHV